MFEGLIPNLPGLHPCMESTSSRKELGDPRKGWEKCCSLIDHSLGVMEITSSGLPQTALTQDHRERISRRQRKFLHNTCYERKFKVTTKTERLKIRLNLKGCVLQGCKPDPHPSIRHWANTCLFAPFLSQSSEQNTVFCYYCTKKHSGQK